MPKRQVLMHDLINKIQVALVKTRKMRKASDTEELKNLESQLEITLEMIVNLRELITNKKEIS